MSGKLINREFFKDKSMVALVSLLFISMATVVVRVLVSVKHYDYKITVRYTQYGADSYQLGNWYSLYELVAFAVLTTFAAIFLASRLQANHRHIAITYLLLQFIVMVFLFMVSNALLSTPSVSS
jgi:hypothetical protein